MAVLFEETVTTTYGSGVYFGFFNYSEVLDVPRLIITFNGATYECEKIERGNEGCFYGGFSETGPVFTEYPFTIRSASDRNYLFTETAGTYTIKVETPKAVNKVVYGSTVLVDMTDATATAADIMEGYTAYGADGQKIIGTATGSSVIVTDTTDEHGGTVRTITTGGVVKLQTKTITPTSSQQVVNPDTGYNGFSQVTVEAGGTTINNQDKSVTPTENQQSVTADSGYTGLGTVSVGAISSTYVGSGIARKSSTDLTASGKTVNVTAGYYASQATKDVATGSATPAASISGSSATVSTGTNTITLSKTVSNTPQVSSGYISSGTAGNSSVSLTASVTTKSAATITPGTTNQTIASGTYLTGTQTIAGDADLVASNIVSGVQIFGVTGNVVLQNYYTGSSAPSSSLGSNGDLYLQS